MDSRFLGRHHLCFGGCRGVGTSTFFGQMPSGESIGMPDPSIARGNGGFCVLFRPHLRRASS